MFSWLDTCNIISLEAAAPEQLSADSAKKKVRGTKMQMPSRI